LAIPYSLISANVVDFRPLFAGFQLFVVPLPALEASDNGDMTHGEGMNAMRSRDVSVASRRKYCELKQGSNADT